MTYDDAKGKIAAGAVGAAVILLTWGASTITDMRAELAAVRTDLAWIKEQLREASPKRAVP